MHIANKQEISLVVREMQFPEKMRTFFTPQICKKKRMKNYITGKSKVYLYSHIADNSANFTSYLESIRPISKL